MPKIKAIAPTQLKLAPVPSDQLPKEHKISVEPGKSFAVTKIETVIRNHCLVKLNLGDWREAYVFAPHWELEPTGKGLGIVGTCESAKGLKAKIVASKLDFVLQPDAQTCQSAAIAMITGEDVWSVRDSLTAHGVAGDPTVMGNHLRDRVSQYKFKLDASLNDIRKAIDDGWQLITHSWFSGSGHVIKISGYEPDLKTQGISFVIDDPWSEFDAAAWSYAPWDRQGNNVRYSARCMYAGCVSGQSVGDAAAIYQSGRLDSAEGAAWLHYCK